MLNPDSLAWDKGDGLIPAIVQHARDGRILMQAYMNREALERTLATGKVTFWSRSRETLWTKGETSGHTLDLVSIGEDCDADSLLVLALPNGPTCHLGVDSCFEKGAAGEPVLSFLAGLEQLITERRDLRPPDSYTTSLFDSGIKRIAQKVGEEGVEVALAATAGDDEEVVNESADLLYHLLVLLSARELELTDVINQLRSRHG